MAATPKADRNITASAGMIRPAHFGQCLSQPKLRAARATARHGSRRWRCGEELQRKCRLVFSSQAHIAGEKAHEPSDQQLDLPCGLDRRYAIGMGSSSSVTSWARLAQNTAAALPNAQPVPFWSMSARIGATRPTPSVRKTLPVAANKRSGQERGDRRECDTAPNIGARMPVQTAE